MRPDQQRFRASSSIPWLLIAAGLAAAPAAADVKLSYSEAAYDMHGEKPRHGPYLPKNGPVITVFAESGSTYSHVAGTHDKLDFRIDYTARCEGVRKRTIDRVSATIAGVKESRDDVSGAYADGQLRVRVPYARLSGLDPAAWCNDRVKTLSLERDVSPAQIVAKGVSLRKREFVTATVFASCSVGVSRPQTVSRSLPMDLWVRCKANPDVGRAKKGVKKSPPGKDKKTSQVFASATIGTEDGSVAAKCPHPMRFEGSIAASGKGTIEYQFIGDGDYESPLKKLTFGKSGTKEFGWTRQIRLPDTSQSLSAGAPPSPEVSGWMALKVIYKVSEGVASTRKTWISERVNFTVDCSGPEKPTPARAKKPAKPAVLRIPEDSDKPQRITD